ncbi:MAG: dTDP-4-dehydrorhamnose reductase [Candidatus Omnitrophica bacterium]|nr:dTDP-4-dehydrorhamnose reductase [Candidatus Omnitrophota bacterium]
MGQLYSGLREKKFLILGAKGQLANAFEDIFRQEGIPAISPSITELDITRFNDVKAFIQKVSPDIILNCAAYNDVESAQTNPELAMLVNAHAVKNLADTCRFKGIIFVHYSSDYVFDGKKGSSYTEDDVPQPLNCYGMSKLKGEEGLRASGAEYLIFRLSWVFGQGTQNFLYKVYQWSKKTDHLKITSDEISSPTYAQDAAHITLLSLERGLRGTFHLTNSGQVSRYEFVRYFIEKKGLSVTVEPALMADFKTKAERPSFSCLSNDKISRALGIQIPSWQNAVDRFIKASFL